MIILTLLWRPLRISSKFHKPNKLQRGFELKAYGKFVKMFFISKGNKCDLENLNKFLTQLKGRWKEHFVGAQNYVDNRPSIFFKPEQLPVSHELKIQILMQMDGTILIMYANKQP